jgi:hypothetical protein
MMQDERIMRCVWGIAILAVWLWIVPFLSASTTFYAWDNRIVGIIAGALGVSLIARHPLEGWVAAIVAVWLFIAGFMGTFLREAGLWWNSAFVGLVWLACAIRVAVEASHHASRHLASHSAA